MDLCSPHVGGIIVDSEGSTRKELIADHGSGARKVLNVLAMHKILLHKTNLDCL